MFFRYIYDVWAQFEMNCAFYNRIMTGVYRMLTISEAMTRITELEAENQRLKEELEYYKNKKTSGRQKHNAKWMAIYNDFVVCYESGMTVVEIAKKSGVSERTMYRYKEYYDSMKQH